MAVVLYRPGTTHEANGIQCELQVFNEYNFLPLLDAGWFLTPEEVYAEKTVEVEEKTEEIIKIIDVTGGLKNKEIRAMAKEAGIQNYKKARIDKLREALNDNQS